LKHQYSTAILDYMEPASVLIKYSQCHIRDNNSNRKQLIVLEFSTRSFKLRKQPTYAISATMSKNSPMPTAVTKQNTWYSKTGKETDIFT